MNIIIKRKVILNYKTHENIYKYNEISKFIYMIDHNKLLYLFVMTYI